MLRPGHHLRSPPATVPTPAFVSVAALPAFSRLHRSSLSQGQNVAHRARVGTGGAGGRRGARGRGGGAAPVLGRARQRRRVRLSRRAPGHASLVVAKKNDGIGIMRTVTNKRLLCFAHCLVIMYNSCAYRTLQLEESERDSMLKTDRIVRLKSIEVDLTANLPRMFDLDVSSRVIAEIRKAFGVQEA